MDWMAPGNTAVVTGGANGIGREAARRFAGAGMNVVIADRNSDALAEAKSEIESVASGSGKVLAVAADVSQLAQVEALRDQAYDAFGSVHCLMNNAGMGIPMNEPWNDLDGAAKILNVNLWGIMHGCHAFIPQMLEQGRKGVVINTGSKQGITRPPGNYAYNLSKAGVLAYTESISHAFTQIEDCPLSAHLLVPGFVYTSMVQRFLPEKPPSAWTAEQTVSFMLERLAEDDFYLLCPDNDVTRDMDEKRIQWNADDMIKNRPALSRWHPDYKSAFEDYMSK